MTTATTRVVMKRDWDEPADVRGDVRHLPANRAVTLPVGIAGFLIAVGYAEPVSALTTDEENLVLVMRTLSDQLRARRIEPTIDVMFDELAKAAEAELLAAQQPPQASGASQPPAPVVEAEPKPDGDAAIDAPPPVKPAKKPKPAA